MNNEDITMTTGKEIIKRYEEEKEKALRVGRPVIPLHQLIDQELVRSYGLGRTDALKDICNQLGDMYKDMDDMKP